MLTRLVALPMFQSLRNIRVSSRHAFWPWTRLTWRWHDDKCGQNIQLVVFAYVHLGVAPLQIGCRQGNHRQSLAKSHRVCNDAAVALRGLLRLIRVRNSVEKAAIVLVGLNLETIRRDHTFGLGRYLLSSKHLASRQRNPTPALGAA